MQPGVAAQGLTSRELGGLVLPNATQTDGGVDLVERPQEAGHADSSVPGLRGPWRPRPARPDGACSSAAPIAWDGRARPAPARGFRPRRLRGTPLPRPIPMAPHEELQT